MDDPVSERVPLRVPSAAELRYPNGVLRTSILAYGWDTARWKLVESWLRPSFWRARAFSYGGDLFMYDTGFKLSVFIHGVLGNSSLILVVPSRS